MNSLLNKQEEYKCCLLPMIVMEGPKSIIQQERDYTVDEARDLIREQGEHSKRD